MELLKGYPDKIIFKTPFDNTITVSCGKEYVRVKYIYQDDLGVTDIKDYKIIEGKNKTLTMIK